MQIISANKKKFKRKQGGKRGKKERKWALASLTSVYQQRSKVPSMSSLPSNLLICFFQRGKKEIMFLSNLGHWNSVVITASSISRFKKLHAISDCWLSLWEWVRLEVRAAGTTYEHPGPLREMPSAHFPSPRAQAGSQVKDFRWPQITHPWFPQSKDKYPSCFLLLLIV